jgi:hypothetical protein
MTSTLPLKQHVEFLSHVTEPLLGVFWLFWQGVGVKLLASITKKIINVKISENSCIPSKTT